MAVASKDKRKKLKEEVNFELVPPGCSSCIHKQKVNHKIKCKIGGWGCEPQSVCDMWENKQGETVE